MKKRITPTKRFADNYDYVMPFGKYRGYKIRYIVDNEPSYILWLSDNDIVKFSDEILEEANNNEEIDVEFKRQIYHAIKSINYYPDEW